MNDVAHNGVDHDEGHNHLVLIVDDDQMNRDMLSRVLEQDDYQVRQAVDGRQALEMVSADPDDIDLILLDMMMPHVSGIEVLEGLKSDELLRHIPVIMISANDDMQSVIYCIELGAEAYLIRPFSNVLLRVRIAAGRNLVAKVAAGEGHVSKPDDDSHVRSRAPLAALSRRDGRLLPDRARRTRPAVGPNALPGPSPNALASRLDLVRAVALRFGHSI